ncbi:MAG TPA: hypothetical protein VHW02_12775 [Rhizomicrobium sp.]|jgi:hypothetical protein|nr:hypothetical protein [Rhizomicrobium sp.]
MKAFLPLALVLLALPAQAQNTAADVFMDGKDGAKVHVASGFVCPQKIGLFERDAVGQSDVDGADFCSYAALDGVYGTITINKLAGDYDPKASLAADFTEQEGTGGKKVGEATIKLNKQSPLSIYARTYQTSSLEDLRYLVLYTGAAVNGWSLETTIEYADPRDTPVEREFLDTVYAAAPAQIGHGAPPAPPASP